MVREETQRTGREPAAPARGENPLGFSLDFLGGRAHVTLAGRFVAEFVRVERLVLEVPEVQFPFDVAGGAGRFRHRRCTLRRLEVTIEAEAFSSWYASRPQLASFGFPSLECRWGHGEIHLESVAHLGDRRVPFVAKLRAIPEPDGWLRLELGRWQVFGYLPVPPSLLGVGLFAAVGLRPQRGSDGEAGGAAPEGGAEALCEARPPWRPPVSVMEGAGVVRVDCLGLLLRELLPAQGWRLPGREGVTLESVEVRPDGLHLVYTSREEEDALAPEPQEGEPGSASEAGRPLWRPRSEDVHRAAEALLAMGRVGEARKAYDERLEADPEDVFARLRLMEIAACAPRLIPEARRMARRLLAEAAPGVVNPSLKTPGHAEDVWIVGEPAMEVDVAEPPVSVGVPGEGEAGHGGIAEAALFVLANTAEEIGEPVEAASRYAVLATLAERQGDLRGAVLATLACGRLLSSPEPDHAISWYERALGLDAQLSEAVAALTELYHRQGRFPDLVRLLRRHLARVTDRRERLVGHITLGQFYLSPLGDALRARAELERAVRLDDTSLEAWDGLAEAHRLAGNHERERAALARVTALWAAQGDEAAVVKARLRLARAWAESGDLLRAMEVTGALVEERPTDADVLERHGRISADAGRWEVAAQTLERLLALQGLAPSRRAEVAALLGQIHVDGLGDPAGARIFVEVSLGAQETEVALLLGLRLAEEEGRSSDVAELLGRLADIQAEFRSRAELEGLGEEAVVAESEEAALRVRQARVYFDDLSDGEAALEALGPVVLRAEAPLPAIPAEGVREALHLQATLLGELGRVEERAEVVSRLGEWLFSCGLPLEEDEIALLAVHGENLARGQVARNQSPAVRRGVALRLLRRLHASAPQDPRPLMALTDLLTSSEEQAEREGLLERLASVTERKGDATRQAAALRELGELRRRQDRPEEAMAALKAASRLAPEDGALHLALGEVASALSAWPEAAAAFAAARRGTVPPRDWARLALCQGQLALREGDLEEASSRFREALAADPAPAGARAVACYQGLLEAFSRSGRWADAAASLEACAADARTGEPPRAITATLFAAAEIHRRQLGDAPAARRLYDAVLKDDPDHLGALNGLTVLEAAVERWPEVAALLERKLELLGGAGEAVPLLEELAALYVTRLGRPEEARSAYDRILAEDPNHHQALWFAAKDAVDCGDADVARRHYLRLLTLGPREGDAAPEREAQDQLAIHRALGRLSLAVGDEERAAEEMVAVLALDPTDTEALGVLDGQYEAHGRWEELAEVLRRRADQASTREEAVEHLSRLAATLEAHLHRIPEAAAVCREVLRREPDSVGALLRQARLLGRWGAEPVERRQVIERLLMFSPRGELHIDAAAGEVLPHRAALLLELGLLLRDELGEPLAGARRLQEALAEGCDDARLHRVLAAMAREESQPEALDRALGRLAEVAEDPIERLSARLEQAEVRLTVLEDPVAALDALADSALGEASIQAVALKARICDAAGAWGDAFDAYAILATRAEEEHDRAAAMAALEPMLTLAMEQLADPDVAKDVAERILAICPDHLPALEALVTLARRLRLAPDLRDALHRWVAARGDEEEDTREAAERLWEAGTLSVRIGDIPGALQQAAQALQRIPGHVSARLLFAEALVLSGQIPEAVDALDELARRLGRPGPSQPEERLRLGEVYREVAALAAERLGEGERARSAWRAAAEWLTGVPLVGVLEAWARSATREERWAEAAEVMERLCGERSVPADSLALADLYERLGRVDDALRVLRQAPVSRAFGAGRADIAQDLRERTRELLAAAGRFGDLARTLEEDARRSHDPARRRELFLEAAEHFFHRAGEGGRAEQCFLAVLREDPLCTPAALGLMDRAESGRRSPGVAEALTRVAEAAVERLRPSPGERGEPEDREGEGPLEDLVVLLSRVAHHRLRDAPEDAVAQGWIAEVLAARPARMGDLEVHARFLERDGRAADLAALLDAALVSPALTVGEAASLRLWSARIHAEALGDPASALRALTAANALGVEARDDEALTLEAALLERLDRLEEAEAVLLALAQKSPEPESHLGRAMALADRRGDAASAIRSAWQRVDHARTAEDKEACLADLVVRCEAASDPRGLARAQRALVAAVADPEIRAARLLDLGRTLIRLEEWAEAQAALAAAVEVTPAAVPIHLELARVAVKRGDLGAARIALATAHDLLPEDAREERAEVSLERSRLEVELDGDRALARRHARQAAEETRRADRRREALRQAAALAAALDESSQEEEALRAIFELGVADDVELHRLAALCAARDAWAEALVVYEHLRTRDPEDPEVRRRLADALRATGQREKAVEQLVAAGAGFAARREGAASSSAFAEAAAFRLTADAGDVEARRLLLRALASEPTSDAIFGQAARLCRQQKDDEGLLEVLRCRLPALDPAGQQAAYREMAQVALCGLGDPDRAAAFLALGLAAGGDEPSLLSSLVIYHADRGDWPVALDYGARLDAVGGPPGEEAAEVYQRLAEGSLARGERALAQIQLRRAIAARPGEGALRDRLETLLAEDGDHRSLVGLLRERASLEEGERRGALLCRAAALCEEHLGDVATAEALLLEALDTCPGDEGLRASLLGILTRQERWSAVFAQTELAYQGARGPRRAELADALAELAEEKLRDPVAAQRYRRLALGDAPADVRRLRALVDLLASQKKWSELVEVVEEALDTMVLDAESVSGFFALLGRSYLEKLNRPDQALVVFERARVRGGLTPRSGELLTELYESSGRFSDLAGLLEELAEGAPDPGVSQRLLVKRARVLADHLGRAREAASVLAELFRVEPARRRKLGAMARKLFVQARLYPDALRLLTEELEVAPETEETELWMERGILFETALGRPDEALAAYQQVLEIAPGYPPAHLRSARLLFESGDRECALGHAEAVIRSGEEPLLGEAHSLAGHVCVELDRSEDAMAHLEVALSHDPTDLELVKELGHFYTAGGHWDRLAENMGRELALTVEPVVRGRLWFRRALVYRDMLDRGGDALRCFREAVSADPTNTEAVAALRDFALERGDWETSLGLLDRQLEMETAPALRVYLLGRRADLLENRLGRMEEAIASLEEALALQGGTDEVLVSRLVRLLVARQDWPRAAALEESRVQGIRDVAARVPALIGVADLHRRAGAPQAAFEALRQAVQVASGDALRQVAQGLMALVQSAEERQALMTLFTSRLEGLGEGAAERRALLRHLLGLAQALGDSEGEARWADALLGVDPSDRAAFAHRRRRLEEAAEWPSVAQLLTDRLKAASPEETLDLLTSLGCIQRERIGDLDAAAHTFDRLLVLRPDDLVALDARADIAFRRGEFLEARELYGRMGRQQGSLDAGERAHRQGHIAEALGEEAEAMEAYTTAIHEHPGHIPSLEALSRLFLMRGMDGEALGPLTDLTELLPPSERALACGLQLARARMRLGQHAEAEEGLTQLAELYPEQLAVQEGLAEAQRILGRWDRLADTLATLVRLVGPSAQRARRLYEEGQVRLELLHDPEGAAKRFLQAADLAPDDPLVVRRLAEHYTQQGRFVEAREASLQLLDLLGAEVESPAPARASAAFGLAITTLLAKGELGREAPALIRQPPVEAMAPRDAAEILAAVTQGLYASNVGPLELRRVFDLVDSALGRASLPRFAEAAERLCRERPADLGLHRFLGRIIARVGEAGVAALHDAVARFLSPPSSEEGPVPEAGRRATPRRSLAVFGPAVADEARVPLRTLLVGLHPHFGRMAPPIDPSVLGPEVEDMGPPALVALCEELKVSLEVGPLGIVFARHPRQPVEILYSLPAVLLLDPELAAWPPVEVRFLLGRAMEWVRSGALFLGSLPGEPLQALLDSVAQVFGVPLPETAMADPRIVERLGQKGVTPDLFDNKTMEALQVAFFNHYRAPTDPQAYLEAERHVANRVGLLVAGGLTESLEALARHLIRKRASAGADRADRVGATGGAVPATLALRRRLVHAEPELAELIRFGTSPLFHQLRRHRSTIPRL